MQKITPCLWFDKSAKEASEFYTSVFNNGKILTTTYYPDAGKETHGMDAGTVLTVNFEIEGYQFLALNAGPLFKFNPSISFMVSCPSVEDVEELWNKISPGGKELMALSEYPFSKRYGWTEDKYGVSWQIIYTADISEITIKPSMMFVQDNAGKAEEAMKYYVSVFESGKVLNVFKYGPNSQGENENNVMYGDFELFGQKFAVMDSSGPHNFKFNEAVSLIVNCKDQAEVDKYWNELSFDPKAEQCGWLKDKYGVSWQITPEGMEKILNDKDKEKGKKAMAAMLEMKKIDLEKLVEAANS